MKYLTILNPNAGSYSRTEQDKICSALTGLEGIVLITPNLADLEQQLQDQRDYHPDLLGIGGGDGTVSRTLTKVKERWPTLPDYIAVYALGTMNNAASSLGASDALMDKIKRFSRVGKTKPVQLAEHIAKISRDEEELMTEELAPLNITRILNNSQPPKSNSQWGFNIGFGLTSKLVWKYYGRSREQYEQTIKAMQRVYESGHDLNEERITLKQRQKSGIVQSARTALECINVMYSPSSAVYQFFNRPLEAALYIDGQKFQPELPITGIYIASYEQQNVGFLRGTPSPGARAVPGEMEILVSFASMKDIIASLPAIRKGRPARKTVYIRAKVLELESEQMLMGQVDGEFVFGKEFVVRPDEPLKFISLR